MKAQELRIGNIVASGANKYDQDTWVIGKVWSISNLEAEFEQLEVETEEEFTWFFKDSYWGVPLTEEWLLRFGFEKEKHAFRIYFGNNFSLSCFSDYDEESNSDGFRFVTEQYLWDGIKPENEKRLSDSSWLPMITLNVHQLQNLYHALTKTELELK